MLPLASLYSLGRPSDCDVSTSAYRPIMHTTQEYFERLMEEDIYLIYELKGNDQDNTSFYHLF